MQDEYGQVQEAHSISAGLDYPGVGPEHSYLASIGRAEYPNVTDAEVIEAFQLMAKAEELEATFLSEMLAHSGLGEMQGSFGGGEGEAQFSSFLRQEQSRLIVQHCGLWLAELIFNSMVKAEDDAA